MYEDLNLLAEQIKSIQSKKEKGLKKSLPKKEPSRSKKKSMASFASQKTKTISKFNGHAIVVSEAIRREKNFLQFPFFVLGKGRGLDKIEVCDVVYDKHGNKAEIYWSVIGSKKYGSPSLMEMKVNNYVERIIDQLPKPIENPIRVGSLYRICKALGRGVSGVDLEQAKKALKCIKAATIETKFTFWLKDKREYYGEPIFSRYDMVFFTGDNMPDGYKADAVYIWLSEPYLQSINANYTVPLDHEYYDSLSIPISQRLYEFYSLQFYPLFEKNLHCSKIRYSKLCKYAPLTQHKVFSYVKRQLEPSHQELIETGFLKSAKYERIKEEKDWLISLFPGDRAKKWYQRSRKEEQLPLFPEEEDNEIFSELINIGITKKTAFELLQEHPLEKIRRQLDWLSYRKPDNKPAVLFKSIQEEWSPPTGYLKEKKRKDRERKEAELKERQATTEKEKKERAGEEEKKLEGYYKSLSKEERADIDRVAEEALDDFMKEKLREGRAKGELSSIVKSGLKWSRNNILKEKLKEEGRGGSPSKKGKKGEEIS